MDITVRVHRPTQQDLHQDDTVFTVEAHGNVTENTVEWRSAKPMCKSNHTFTLATTWGSVSLCSHIEPKSVIRPLRFIF